MDNAMADIQADDMKHGLYDDPKMAADQLTQLSQELGMYNRTDLPDLIAHKLLEVATMDDLESTYYEYQLEWAESLPEEELMQTARDLGIEI